MTAAPRIRRLDQDFTDAGSALVGLVVALEPPSAPAATASAPVAVRPPLWGAVSRPAFVPRGPGRYSLTLRAYPLGGSSGTTPILGGFSGPPLAPFSFFTSEGSELLRTPRPVNPGVWSGLGRSIGELPSNLNNVVDATLIVVLSRTLVRLCKEVTAILSRLLGGRDVELLYYLGTVETLRRLLTEECGSAVADTRTDVAGKTLRLWDGSSTTPRGACFPAAPPRPPSPPPPHYGASARFSSQVFYGVDTGSSANPLIFSGPRYYAPEKDRSHDYDPGYGTRARGW